MALVGLLGYSSFASFSLMTVDCTLESTGLSKKSGKNNMGVLLILLFGSNL